MGDPTLAFRSVYPPSRLFTASSSSTLMPPPPLQPSQPYLHPSPSSRLSSYPSQYPINDYYVGHVLGSSSSSPYPNYHVAAPVPDSNNYTCIGAPVGLGFGRGADLGGSGGGGTTINRFQDGF